MKSNPLDEAAHQASEALTACGALRPSALLLLGTGVGVLPGRLKHGGRASLADVGGVPEVWREVELHWGDFHGVPVWMLDDAPGDSDPAAPDWHAAFPIWLAAASGASTMIHTSAGASLGDGGPALGAIALARDHLNLSGASPLSGLGESRLGPLFPDQTRTHDPGLRTAALARCRALELEAREAVVACTSGPALETPAERRFASRAGADVSVQGLAAPLIAAAHAGLGTLAIVVVAAHGDAPVDVAKVAAVCGEVAPALDDLLWTLAGDLQRQARLDLERAGS